ncbi:MULTISPECIES: type III secretion system cytoplasmic ring protein SctQ [Pseudomonas]|uniref:Type III secretion system apparatus protein YscQ/HrcQ n=1 Tax=Pseudomonas lutea TaxID=243924 RepID=A0A9X8MCZ3_9PSED|nr:MULTISPECIES: type III secretion system cytoplasmic ring protein SctQ [Pseudomonas]SEQ56424.1 type III secretion system apparatus protein YscQ/HrcQ [Pseudomonas lutea]
MWMTDTSAVDEFCTSEEVAPLVFPLVTLEDVRLANRVYRSREDWQGKITGHPVSVRLAWNSQPIQSALSFPLMFDEQPACLQLPSSLAQALGGALLEGIGAPARFRALLIEQALLTSIQPIEQSTGFPIRFAAGLVDIPHPIRLSFQVTLRDKTYPVMLDLSATTLSPLLPCLDQTFPASDLPLSQLRLPVTLCIGSQQVRLSELQGLQLGDVVMLRSNQGAWISVENRLRASLAVVASGYQLQTGLVLTSVSKEWDMSDTSMHKTTAEDDPLGEVPITLVCEAGRLELPLGEVKALSEGSILAFPDSTDEAVEITVNGRRLGRGTLVRIGEGLGVRITSLSTHG